LPWFVKDLAEAVMMGCVADGGKCELGYHCRKDKGQ